MTRIEAWSSRERQGDHATLEIHGRVEQAHIVTEPVARFHGNVVTVTSGESFELGTHLFGAHRNAEAFRAIAEYLGTAP